MIVQFELWQLMTLTLTLIGFAIGAVRALFSQVDRRLTERFLAAEQAYKLANEALDQRVSVLLEQVQRESKGWRELEREFLQFRADLPIAYVRRDDYVRNQTVIEAKLDAVALKIENLQLKKAQHD